MKDCKMQFIEISTSLRDIRVALGMEKPKQATAKKQVKGCNGNNSKLGNDTDRTGKKSKGKGGGEQQEEEEEEQKVFHLEWQIVPYVPTQFPSLHRDVITIDEFAESLAEVEKEEREREEAERAEKIRKNGGFEVDTESESEDTEDRSDEETRSDDESSDSEMDEFVVADDKHDTDKEDEEEEEEEEVSSNGNNGGDDAEEGDPRDPQDPEQAKELTQKKALKKELKNLGLSSGEVGEAFPVAKEGLGKRTRRQTDHLAERIFQAGDISREIDCYDSFDHETKKFKPEAYHRAGSTKTLWEKPKKPVLALTTGQHAGWVKAALTKRDSSIKKTKPGQRPCAASMRASDQKAKRKSDIRSYLCR